MSDFDDTETAPIYGPHLQVEEQPFHGPQTDEPIHAAPRDVADPAASPATATSSRRFGGRTWWTSLPSSKQFLISVAACAIAALLIGGAAIEWRHHGKASQIERSITNLRDEVKAQERSAHRAQARRDHLSDSAAKLQTEDATIDDRASAYRTQIAQLTRSIGKLQERVDSLVSVPDVGAMELGDAESAMSDAGLSDRVQYIDGDCADYKGHFVDRELSWYNVVRQETRPGTLVPPGSKITITLFDTSSGWEVPCQQAILDAETADADAGF